MGCTASRLQDSDIILQCKERKRLMKNALHTRHEFPAAHVSYIQTLRNVGYALRKFAEGDVASSPTSCPSPSPVLALTEAFSSSVPLLSPPSSPPPTIPSKSIQSITEPVSDSTLPLSPPPSSPPPPLPPLVPHVPVKSASPPSSPLALSHMPPFEDSRLNGLENASSHGGDRQEAASGMVSPDRGSDFSPPFYSPDRSNMDEYFISFSAFSRGSQLPPSPLPSVESSWFLYDIFNAPPIPYHLQERRRLKNAGEMEELEEREEKRRVLEDEGIPELEDDDQKEDKEKPEDGGALATVMEVPEGDAGASEEKLTVTLPSHANDGAQENPVAIGTVDSPVVENAEKLANGLSVITVSKSLDLTKAVRHIDTHFTKASRSGQDVSGVLEAGMKSYVVEGKEPPKVYGAITMHLSHRTTMAMRDAYKDSAILQCGMAGSHALTLERIYAWEKKLYDEVKAGELIRVAFDHKCKQLQSLDATGGDVNVIEKTRASLKKLDTQLLVALKAIHLASQKIQELTEDELYPQLAELLGGLLSMWKVMLECHKAQKAIALEMQSLSNSVAGDEASAAHRKATIDLEHALEMWQAHFQLWIGSQKSYITVLYEWLSKCHLYSDVDMQERHAVSQHSILGVPPVCTLLRNWQKSLSCFERQQEVVDAISNFAAVVHSLKMEQSDEIGLRRQVERFSRDLDHRTRKLEKRRMESSEESDSNMGSLQLYSRERDNLKERRAELDSFRSAVDGEKHRYFLAVQGRWDTTLSGLQGNLPTVFGSMASFAEDALQEYEKLQQEMEIKKSPHRENGIAHRQAYVVED